jgi:hypothetical protein
MRTPGDEARDEGMARVESSHDNWRPGALALADKIAREKFLFEEITGEDIRLAVEGTGYPKPAEPRVWGTITRELIKTGRLVKIDKMRKPIDVKSHSRPLQMYRVNHDTTE